jgi:hypothetical protein
MDLYLVQGSRLEGGRVTRSFFSRISDYAIGFVAGIAGGYMAKEVGSMIAERLHLGEIGDWGATGLGILAMFLAGRFVIRGFLRVLWPFYAGLAVGVAMATGIGEKLSEMLGLAKKEAEKVEQSTEQSSNTTQPVAGG